MKRPVNEHRTLYVVSFRRIELKVYTRSGAPYIGNQQRSVVELLQPQIFSISLRGMRLKQGIDLIAFKGDVLHLDGSEDHVLIPSLFLLPCIDLSQSLCAPVLEQLQSMLGRPT